MLGRRLHLRRYLDLTFLASGKVVPDRDEEHGRQEPACEGFDQTDEEAAPRAEGEIGQQELPRRLHHPPVRARGGRVVESTIAGGFPERCRLEGRLMSPEVRPRLSKVAPTQKRDKKGLGW